MVKDYPHFHPENECTTCVFSDYCLSSPRFISLAEYFCAENCYDSGNFDPWCLYLPPWRKVTHSLAIEAIVKTISAQAIRENQAGFERLMRFLSWRSAIEGTGGC